MPVKRCSGLSIWRAVSKPPLPWFTGFGDRSCPRRRGAPPDAARAPPDAKTALQEYAQGQRRGLPEYKEVGRSGADHAPSFTVEVTVKGLRPALREGTPL